MPMINESSAFNEDTFMCDEFLRLKEKYGIEIAVETGTYHGITTLWLSKNFSTVYTTEINKAYRDQAVKNLSGVTNVNFYLNDSITALPEILKKCNNKTIIFLDAHWYKNPVLKELEIIAQSGLKPIIAIHDFKNPNHPDYGFDIYPDQNIVYEWKWVEAYIKAIYGEGKFEHYYNDKATGAKRGCLFLIPK
jgi:hypothetical protein